MSIRLGRQALGVWVVLLVGCWALPASAVNLIKNPSFEGPGSLLDLGWESFAFTTAPVIVPSEARTGSQALKITAGTSSTGSSGVFYWDQHTDVPPLFRSAISVIPGGTYTATVYSKAENPPMVSDETYGGANIRLMFFDENNVGVESSPENPETKNTVQGIGASLTANYQQFSVADDVPEDAVYVGVGLYAAHNSSAVFFDDVSVEFTPGPTSPLMQLNIDRGTGKMTLDVTGLVDIPIKGYSITSSNGSLDPTRWTSVTGNYDTGTGGNGSVDDDDDWTRLSETSTELHEREDGGGDGGLITVSQAAVDLSTANNLWVKSPVEDIQFRLELDTGQIIPGIVNFFGGPTGSPYVRSDFNFDGSITSADWPTLRDNLLTDFNSLSKPLAYQEGDLNGDKKVDFADFYLFKNDYEAANGLGAFDAMLAGVPEPVSLLLLGVGAIGLSLTRQRKLLRGLGPLTLIAMMGSTPPSKAMAANVDFTTFTLDNGLRARYHNIPNYSVTGGGSVATLNITASDPEITIPQANAHSFYGNQSVFNKRITGTINPGLDDDIFGLLLGYDPGEMTSTSANYLLLDWMGPAQVQNFEDHPDTFGSGQFFHDKTNFGAVFNQNGLALSRVTGTPTGDELWVHINDSFNNPEGGVAVLQRGVNWGTKRYPYEDIQFDIAYTASRVTVKINGVPEIDVTGTFGDGRLGLYSLSQAQEPLAPTYKDFRITGIDEVLKATVNTVSGTITLSNNSSEAISIVGYSLESAMSSLKPSTWMSLQDQDLPGFEASTGIGNGWEESLGSNATKLVETDADLGSGPFTGSSFADTLTISLGAAYDATVDAQDLLFTYYEASGLRSTGLVEYVSTVEDADFDGDGDVDGRDFLTWQRGFGLMGQVNNSNGDANGDGKVDGGDLTVWQAQYGTAGALSSIQTVPEPASALMLLIVACGLGTIRPCTQRIVF